MEKLFWVVFKFWVAPPLPEVLEKKVERVSGDRP